MSYADAASKGPAQRPEDKLPDTVPEIAHSDSGVHSLDSLSSSSAADGEPHMASYAEQQKAAESTQADIQRNADKVARDAKDFTQKAETDAQRLEAQAAGKYQDVAASAQQNYSQAKATAGRKYADVKKEVGVEADRAEAEAKKAEEWTEKNKENPVVIGNVVVVGAVAAVMGTQGYRMHRAGTLTWKVAGAWAGIVGLVGVVDYFGSQWLFRNKYPPKE
ncbi:hypothetical protein B0A50_02822 [Salinomyces thailandicus]|uniref:Uncharacterized protein n=1 Tax=Salinomyces thailandicus TaxID=706561 RepID=A0A4U0U4R1_9PEZI|nr:hypothetical protein B0A50_02822 [Salinomyces thailandica]